jgi:hypothetical protein
MRMQFVLLLLVVHVAVTQHRRKRRGLLPLLGLRRPDIVVAVHQHRRRTSRRTPLGVHRDRPDLHRRKSARP